LEEDGMDSVYLGRDFFVVLLSLLRRVTGLFFSLEEGKSIDFLLLVSTGKGSSSSSLSDVVRMKYLNP